MPTFNSASTLRPHHLTDAITAESGQTTLTTAQTDMIAWIKGSTQSGGLNRTFACPRCQTKGQYPLSNDTGNQNDTENIECVTCDGWGYTLTQVTPVIKWPINQ